MTLLIHALYEVVLVVVSPLVLLTAFVLFVAILDKCLGGPTWG